MFFKAQFLSLHGAEVLKSNMGEYFYLFSFIYGIVIPCIKMMKL